MSTLFVLATPIGNLEDLSVRVSRILSEVDQVAAEDTRRTGRLLKQLSITTPMVSLHDHNEKQLAEELVHELLQGKDMALVSDAGTPLISDPGYELVRLCHEAGIVVVPVPGPSSVTAALSVSGIATDRLAFEGFVPAKPKARAAFFRELSTESRTLVMFETPHRIEASLKAMAQEMGDQRRMTLCRELTKTYEQIVTGVIPEVLKKVVSGEVPAKGEFVLVVSGSDDVVVTEADSILQALLTELPPSKAASIAATLTEHSKSILYERALVLKESS